MPKEQKNLERKLAKNFDVTFSKPVEFEKNGLKWQEFPVVLKARDGGYINHWAWGKVVHDFAGMETPSNGKIPIDHVHSDDALGFIDEFDTSDGNLVLKGKFISTKEGDLAWDIATKIAAGVPYQSSIFFDDLENGQDMKLEIVGNKKEVVVNGKRFEGYGTIVRNWLLRGVATCLYGADSQTATQTLKHQEGGKPIMDPKDILKQFTELFGAELANQYFTDGLDLDAATKKFNGVLQERLAEGVKLAASKDAEIAALKTQLEAAVEKEKQLAASADKLTEVEKKLGEAEEKLEVWNKQYGGVPYSSVAEAQGNGDTAATGNAASEYAKELQSVIGSDAA